jgi:hypothetical protein
MRFGRMVLALMRFGKRALQRLGKTRHASFLPFTASLCEGVVRLRLLTPS